jgi:hypothetical protein
MVAVKFGDIPEIGNSLFEMYFVGRRFCLNFFEFSTLSDYARLRKLIYVNHSLKKCWRFGKFPIGTIVRQAQMLI